MTGAVRRETASPADEAGRTDPRIERAARNNALWCDAVCAAHGAPGEFHDAVWLNRHGTPRHYPDLVTLGGTPEDQLKAIETLIAAPRLTGWAIKDSFSCLDLAPLGFSVLFEAEWIGHQPEQADLGAKGEPGLQWQWMQRSSDIVAWERAWAGDGFDLAGPATFAGRLAPNEDIRFLLARDGGNPVAGAIVNRTAELAGISNVFAAGADRDAVWRAIAREVAAACPGIPIVGYEHDPDLASALRAGFTSLGPLRVWVRA